MSNIFSENDTYIMWTDRKFNKGWLNPRDEKGRFTKEQTLEERIQALEKRIKDLEHMLDSQIDRLNERIEKIEGFLNI